MNIDNIKERLSKIQPNFNPEKSTYKIIEKIIKGDLNPKEVLEELSKIKTTSKFPKSLKDELTSIINDLRLEEQLKLKEEQEEKQKEE